MVLGRDLGLVDVIRISLCELVGQFGYRAVATYNVGMWIAYHQKPLIGYMPKDLRVAKGCYCFIFCSKEDASKICEGVYLLGRGCLMLKHWSHLFDPFTIFSIESFGFSF